MSINLTRKEDVAEWSDLIDIPEREERQRTEKEDLRLTALTAALYAMPIDNSDRIAALFLELDTCDNFSRMLEIDQALRDYGVEAVTPEENRQLEQAAEMGPQKRYPL